MAATHGEWTAELSGGCPKFESWHENPQFQLWSKGGTYSLELRQHAQPADLSQIGLWVMIADDPESRKRHITSADTIGKSKFKATEQQILTLALPPREDGLPYIIVCSTFQPSQLGTFTLRASSTEDDAPRIVPLQPLPTSAARTFQPSGAHSRAAAVGKLQPALGDFNPTGTKLGGAPEQLRGRATASSPVPSNEPVVEVEGQGLSTKLEAELAAVVEVRPLGRCPLPASPA